MLLTLLTSLSLFILFGYLEQTLSLGWLVSAALLLHSLTRSLTHSPLPSKRSLATVTLFALQFALADKTIFPSYIRNIIELNHHFFEFYERQRLSGGVFLVMVWLCLSAEEKWEDVHVDFAPYEQEVRRFLLEHDPSLLYKVDEWLRKYKGREELLMQKLQKKYETTSPDASPNLPTHTRPTYEQQQQQEEAHRLLRKMEEEEMEEERRQQQLARDLAQDHQLQCELEEYERIQRHLSNERFRQLEAVRQEEQAHTIVEDVDVYGHVNGEDVHDDWSSSEDISDSEDEDNIGVGPFLSSFEAEQHRRRLQQEEARAEAQNRLREMQANRVMSARYH